MVLTVADDSFGGLGFRRKGDSVLLKSVDNLKMLETYVFKNISYGVTSWRINAIIRHIL